MLIWHYGASQGPLGATGLLPPPPRAATLPRSCLLPLVQRARPGTGPGTPRVGEEGGSAPLELGPGSTTPAPGLSLGALLG